MKNVYVLVSKSILLLNNNSNNNSNNQKFKNNIKAALFFPGYIHSHHIAIKYQNSFKMCLQILL